MQLKKIIGVKSLNLSNTDIFAYFSGKWAKKMPFSVTSEVMGEGNGNPLQYSCLENPMDRGAW